MFLVELIGAETVRTFFEKHVIDYHDMQMDFEGRKRETKGSDDQIPFKLPDSLRQLWERAEDKEIDDILEEKEGFGEIEYMTGRLFLEAKIIHRFFQETIDGLLKYINEEVFSEMSNISVNSIILLGEFAESNYVMQYVSESLRSLHIPVVRPQLPELVVLNGAVLFGQTEKIVTSIILRHSYGIAMTTEFVQNKHKEDEKYELDNMIMANNVFRKHATIGQTVPINEWTSSKEYYPENERDRKTTFFIFTSDSVDPVHTTEKGCKYIGQVGVDFGYNSDSTMRKAVKVEFKFGATELKVRAVTSTSSKQHVSYFNLQ
ncbi:heat shock 70 kDa protein 12B-like [Ruditapes philippinarum]|uniref:heat shock 70 kDa protein 12B-like n=1 Tax=Ruditapes philippinarum TaxID=129788 RepID=UPI00295B275F|nr:heat shock 70 kDa protein 12B-like [Ruditapes philippinarum]